MSVESHIAALRQRHADLDDKIRREETHAAYNSVEVKRMKMEKLHVKEEIDRLSH
ncbi:YdcH family protein [Azospirillum halopraeferens]|uniref:YdcH family protein n=1 Tax=Azospirillum halopraeferens TaxID=34010 RepID=UPI00041D280C|nr:YdcH family protein [Azospirillum halopraeferens]